MRDPLTDDGNVQASQQWTINGPHNWTIFHSTAGPALAARDGAVMSASTGPAPGPRGMLTGFVPMHFRSRERNCLVTFVLMNCRLLQPRATTVAVKLGSRPSRYSMHHYELLTMTIAYV